MVNLFPFATSYGEDTFLSSVSITTLEENVSPLHKCSCDSVLNGLSSMKNSIPELSKRVAQFSNLDPPSLSSSTGQGREDLSHSISDLKEESTSLKSELRDQTKANKLLEMERDSLLTALWLLQEDQLKATSHARGHINAGTTSPPTENIPERECLIIGSNYNLANLGYSPEIRLGDTIKRVYSAKSLGVYIDDRLSWSTHINHVEKREVDVAVSTIKKNAILSSSSRVYISSHKMQLNNITSAPSMRLHQVNGHKIMLLEHPLSKKIHVYLRCSLNC